MNLSKFFGCFNHKHLQQVVSGGIITTNIWVCDNKYPGKMDKLMCKWHIHEGK